MPAAIQPCCQDGGWTIVSKPKKSPFRIITELEFADEYGSKILRDAFTAVNENVSDEEREGIDEM